MALTAGSASRADELRPFAPPRVRPATTNEKVKGKADDTANERAHEKLEAFRLLSLEQFPAERPGDPLESRFLFAVTSAGCTEGKDFELLLASNGNVQELKMRRTRQDDCKRVPFEARVEIITNQLLGAERPIVFLNPVLSSNRAVVIPGEKLRLERAVRSE